MTNILSTLVSVLSEISDYATERDSRSAATNALLGDLVSAVEALEVSNNTVVSFSNPCGCGANPPLTYNPPTPDPLDPATDPNPNSPQFNSWDEYLCAMGHVYADNVAGMIGEYKSLFAAGAITFVFVTAVAAVVVSASLAVVGGIAIAAGAIVALVDFLSEITDVLFFDDATSAVEEIRDDIICAIYESTSAGEAIGKIETAIDGSTASAPVKEFLKLIVFPGQVEVIYAGQNADGETLNIPDGYVGSICNCSPPADWSKVYGSDNEGDFYAPSGNTGLYTDRVWMGGDDPDESSSGWERGDVVGGAPSIRTISRIDVLLSIESRTAGCEDAEFRIQLKDRIVPVVTHVVAKASDIGDYPNPTWHSITGSFDMATTNSDDFRCATKNVNWPTVDLPQKFGLHEVRVYYETP